MADVNILSSVTSVNEQDTDAQHFLTEAKLNSREASGMMFTAQLKARYATAAAAAAGAAAPIAAVQQMQAQPPLQQLQYKLCPRNNGITTVAFEDSQNDMLMLTPNARGCEALRTAMQQAADTAANTIAANPFNPGRKPAATRASEVCDLFFEVSLSFCSAGGDTYRYMLRQPELFDAVSTGTFRTTSLDDYTVCVDKCA
jgi:hypothetical protein